MAALWPQAAHTAGNAGVFLVGISEQNGGVPVALLGGRWYTGKKVYVFTDFGGGVDRKTETPQHGAFREFAEELLGDNEKEANKSADKLCAADCPLVGGKPFVFGNKQGSYVYFILEAESVVESLGLPVSGRGRGSAIDHLFAIATRNAELTSVALVGLEELMRGASQDGIVRPLSVRDLDGQQRNPDQICLRNVMVGSKGSISAIRDVLESFIWDALAQETVDVGDAGAPEETGTRNQDKSKTDDKAKADTEEVSDSVVANSSK